ncbi:MAG: hypothetical protein LBB23_05065 [Rickettsiales bacterium]|nr:hypothetical protein [Rickettsiales bacterium]
MNGFIQNIPAFRLRFATARQVAGMTGRKCSGWGRETPTRFPFFTTTPALRATPSPAKGTFVRLHKVKGIFVRLTSTNHPVRLRFATARHPSTLEGNFFAEIARSSRAMTYLFWRAAPAA